MTRTGHFQCSPVTSHQIMTATRQTHRYVGRSDSGFRSRLGATRHPRESAFCAGDDPGCLGKHEQARCGPGGRSPTRHDRGAGAASHHRAPSRRGSNSIGHNTPARVVGDNSPITRHAVTNTDDPRIAHEIDRVGPGRIPTKAQRHCLFPAYAVHHQRGGAGRWRGNPVPVLDKPARRSTQPVAEEQSTPEGGRLPLVDQSVLRTSLTLDRWRSSLTGYHVPHPTLLCG